MAKWKTKKLSTEERKFLARSQMMEASKKLLQVTDLLAKNLGLGSALLVSESPLAVTRINHGSVAIDFLYGPAEFHVEMVLSHQPFQELRLSLAELFSHQQIKEWAIDNVLKEKKKSIESEVNWFSALLSGPCSEVISAPESFFNRFRHEDQKA